VSDTVRRFLPEGPATEPGGIVFLDGLILQRVAVDLAIDREDYGDALSWLQANDLWLAWNGSVLGRADNRLSWAAYFRAIGKHSEAIDCANAAVAMASEPEQPLALLAALRLRGELKTASGNCDAAALDLQRSLKLAKACEAPLERAKSLVALAELSRAQGHIEEASVGFAEAQAIAEELRARVLLDRISAQETRTGDQHSQAPAGLTRRELEVLSLVAQGMTDADVASHLFISPRTVGQHLRSIYNKLDVSSRVAATRFAIDHNLT
jgi:DNA-binding CsgD family transcriptional regulator